MIERPNVVPVRLSDHETDLVDDLAQILNARGIQVDREGALRHAALIHLLHLREQHTKTEIPACT